MKNRTSSIPIAEKKTDSKILHGVVYEDDYSWLRDSQWQNVLKDPSLLDPKIGKYLKLENDYSDIVLAPLNSLKEEILEEMKGRMKRDDASVPIDHGEFAYFYKYIPWIIPIGLLLKLVLFTMDHLVKQKTL